MSVFRMVKVDCDFCKVVYHVVGVATDAEARRDARTQAEFRRVKHDGQMKDICPNCFGNNLHREAQS